ncbi:MAG: transcriptional repressor [Verrucomicrobiales bacterium]|nr:transcriptional repressor [Verrucomicrobiales bacterium]
MPVADHSPSELRLTPQRRMVLDVVLEERDHPTATKVFLRVKPRMPSISLATVYNCLDALTQAGLVRQVNLDRGPSRYCPNLADHGHFFCERCGDIRDVPLQAEGCALKILPVEPGSVIRRLELALHGLCPKCASQG